MIEINWSIRRKPALLLILFVFMLTILIRLPNLNRPLSKHHEFNDAIILISGQSWRQAGGGAVFHYSPLLNYQNPGDLHADTGVHIDPKGNHLYISMGPAFFLFPYAFFQVFHLPIEPVPLRIFNLLWSALTAATLVLLLLQLIPARPENDYFSAFMAATLFLCTPSILWYTGNVVVHTAIMMPFVLGYCCLLLPMLSDTRTITPGRLFAMALSLIGALYCDWFAVPLGLAGATCALLKARKEPKCLQPALTTGAALLAGVVLIFWQFASYAGSARVLTYWRSRFLVRTVQSSASDSLFMIKQLLANLATAYGPLLLLLAVIAVLRWSKRQPLHLPPDQRRFLAIYGAALLIYYCVLPNWAAGHDYSMVPAAVLLSWLAAISLPASLPPRTGKLLLGLTLMLSLAQYYFINRPGPVSQTGMRYDDYAVFGRHLHNVPADYTIFSNLPEWSPTIEFYAGRNITLEPNRDSALSFIRQFHVRKAVWAESNGFTFVSLDTLDRP